MSAPLEINDVIFIPLIGVPESDRPDALLSAVENMRGVVLLRANAFINIPNAPLAYWLTPRCMEIMSVHEPLQAGTRVAKQGLATADDFRFLRLWWEIPPSNLIGASIGCTSSDEDAVVAECRAQSVRGKLWASFAKGGAYSPFYADIVLVVNWGRDGFEIRNFVNSKTGRTASRPQNTDYFFRPGLTWPLRTNGLSFRVMPLGCVFGHKGPALFAESRDELLCLLALLNTTVVEGIVHGLGVGRVEIQSYEVGTIQSIPVPPLRAEMTLIASKAWRASHASKLQTETSHSFVMPFSEFATNMALAEIAQAEQSKRDLASADLRRLQMQAEEFAIGAYGLGASDLESLKKLPGVQAARAELGTEDEAEAEAEAEIGISHGVVQIAADILHWVMGVALGRWDIRHATGEKPKAELPDPFEPLPAVSPGQLQNVRGLPAGAAEVPGGYPVTIPWDGILVDDPDHPLDIVRRVREAIEIVWKDRAEAIENEACETLGVTSLRDYFRKPSAFFAEHLKRYSKSKRKAPIYWPLSTASGSYTVWLYCHRFNKDTLYKALEHVKEKITHQEQQHAHRLAEAGPSPSGEDRKEITALADFVTELRALYEELVRVAPLWEPDLDDGVIINYALLWRMIAYKPWQKTVKTCWDELIAGDYDWAKVAMHLWPERVLPKCTIDRSLAIAHGIEDVFWMQHADGKWVARTTPIKRIDDIVRERTSPAVKTALGRLVDAPTASNVGRSPARRKGHPAARTGRVR